MVTESLPATEPAKVTVPDPGAATGLPGAALKSMPQWPAKRPWGANSRTTGPGTGATRTVHPDAITVLTRFKATSANSMLHHPATAAPRRRQGATSGYARGATHGTHRAESSEARGAAMTVHYDRRDRVAVITVDRPQRRNAIDDAVAIGLNRAWRRFDEDEDADVGILTGAGETFCAGADLRSFDLVDRPEGFIGISRIRVSKPTIAAVEGYCVAGGLELALWCDLRVAGESAVFGCFERRFGVPLVDGGTQRLPRVVGLGRALDMILTGRAVGAQEALDIGLANRVCPDGEALATAVAIAQRVSSFPQPTVRSDRAALLDGLGLTLDDGLAREREHGLIVWETAVEGARRFAAGAGRHGEGI